MQQSEADDTVEEAPGADRRGFLKTAIGVAAGATVGIAAASTMRGNQPAANGDPAVRVVPGRLPTAAAGTATSLTTTDQDILNLLLALQFLERDFYTIAYLGPGSLATVKPGVGTAGVTTGGHKVTFADFDTQYLAREFAFASDTHTSSLYTLAGGSASAVHPAIDLSSASGGAFSTFGRLAGIADGSGIFDPYASDANFLLAAFLIEDVLATAYQGLFPLIQDATARGAMWSTMGAKALMVGAVRSLLYYKGNTTPSVVSSANAISDARDGLDGSTDLDKGISPVPLSSTQPTTLSPTDANGITFTRSAGQALNIFYLNSNAVAAGGFFPNGVNGTLHTSMAN